MNEIEYEDARRGGTWLFSIGVVMSLLGWANLVAFFWSFLPHHVITWTVLDLELVFLLFTIVCMGQFFMTIGWTVWMHARSMRNQTEHLEGLH